MPAKLSLLIQVTTTPTNIAQARIHTGGWSETIWTNNSSFALPSITTLATRRALMLSQSAAVIGYRTQVFTIAANRLVPGGTASGNLNLPGLQGIPTDLPQVALSMKAQSDETANTRKFNVRGVPDNVMVGGEYQPPAYFLQAVRLYIQELTSGVWWFPGRNLAQASVPIQGVANGVLTTVGNPGWAVGDSIRFLKARQTNGLPFTGTYVIQAPLVAANQFTLANLDTTIKVGTIGRVRRDEVLMCRIAACETGRAVVRKIGRPFETYHGRRSKRL